MGRSFILWLQFQYVFDWRWVCLSLGLHMVIRWTYMYLCGPWSPTLENRESRQLHTEHTWGGSILIQEWTKTLIQMLHMPQSHFCQNSVCLFVCFKSVVFLTHFQLSETSTKIININCDREFFVLYLVLGGFTRLNEGIKPARFWFQSGSVRMWMLADPLCSTFQLLKKNTYINSINTGKKKNMIWRMRVGRIWLVKQSISSRPALWTGVVLSHNIVFTLYQGENQLERKRATGLQCALYLTLSPLLLQCNLPTFICVWWKGKAWGRQRVETEMWIDLQREFLHVSESTAARGQEFIRTPFQILWFKLMLAELPQRQEKSRGQRGWRGSASL